MQEGKKVAYLVPMSGPTDIPFIKDLAVLMTISGGVTCHAAIVARSMGVPAIIGLGASKCKLDVKDSRVVMLGMHGKRLYLDDLPVEWDAQGKITIQVPDIPIPTVEEEEDEHIWDSIQSALMEVDE